MPDYWQLEESLDQWQLEESIDLWELEESGVVPQEIPLLLMAPLQPGMFKPK